MFHFTCSQMEHFIFFVYLLHWLLNDTYWYSVSNNLNKRQWYLLLITWKLWKRIMCFLSDTNKLLFCHRVPWLCGMWGREILCELWSWDIVMGVCLWSRSYCCVIVLPATTATSCVSCTSLLLWLTNVNEPYRVGKMQQWSMAQCFIAPSGTQSHYHLVCVSDLQTKSRTTEENLRGKAWQPLEWLGLLPLHYFPWES